MSTNPYRDTGADDDLFERPSTTTDAPGRHRFDGKLCPSCGFPHDLSRLGIDLDDLSVSERRKLEEMLNAMPDMILAKALTTDPAPPQSMLFASFVDYLDDMDIGNTNGPLLRAIMTVLDEVTGGRVTSLWRVYEAERRLIIGHAALKSLNNVRTKAAAKGEAREGLDDRLDNPRVLNMLDLLLEFMVDRIAADVIAYRSCCERHGVEPVTQLIDSGTFPDDIPLVDRILSMQGLSASIFDLDL